ncbi:MAG: SPOR domain-containing protein [candidate division Zixibacteria bacterium]|nr:SPOR domain-containing protein [candidate division Zixibacteria bacterium]
MTKRASIFSLLITALWLIWGAGCILPQRGGEESSPDAGTIPEELARYDPLESSQDRQVVPSAYPSDQPINAGGSQQEIRDEATGDTGYLNLIEPIDTLNNQAFRVQILTTKVYGEARTARRVAEEIFDRPVFMDYEVPYFKLRVGNFAEREAAENYQQRAKAAGYTNAWVVVVTVGVEEPTPLYETSPATVGDSLDYEHDQGQDD